MTQGGRALISQAESSRAVYQHLQAGVLEDGTDPSAPPLLQEQGVQLTQPGVDVAENASRLHSDGVDICHSLHVDVLLPQDSLDPLCLCQDAHCGGRTGSAQQGHKGVTALPLAFGDTYKVPQHVEAAVWGPFGNEFLLQRSALRLLTLSTPKPSPLSSRTTGQFSNSLQRRL